ncbi:hypothetical protein LG52_2388 [Geobacillus kaustophilus]|uniref:Uncharacterized protein n=1 Tax=Geobacillus kaustophilus TaxID=1462 RepID=A0A0D8BXE7_GEOKU|nr:hypothetical protein LG52_2388 [Geobacillus kaustophilus]
MLGQGWTFLAQTSDFLPAVSGRLRWTVEDGARATTVFSVREIVFAAIQHDGFP